MDNSAIDTVFEILERAVRTMQLPIVSRVAFDNDPFKVLISTMLSLRTKDSTTEDAFDRLFKVASSPEELARTPESVIEKEIFPVGFYKTKAISIRETSRIIHANHAGRVPDTMEELLTLPGVGRKTANLVLILGFDKMGICVDTHVHRITNRWGYVSTKTPDETEMRLRDILPQRYWKRINDCLVPYGQNLCAPISPFCSRCKLVDFCDRVNVKKSR
ncbi:MAG TPA: endonuclease III [Deltaproteobacteria bacterium]|nr:endonuclease III [Deltaproteobacteria bacterium]